MTFTYQERERAAEEEEQREVDIARGNPLLNSQEDFNIKRRWDDDVVFKNQARGTENRDGKEFVNVCHLFVVLSRRWTNRCPRIFCAPISTSGSWYVLDPHCVFYTS